MTKYRVTYEETELTPLIDMEKIKNLPTINVTISEIEDNCEAYCLIARIEQMSENREE
jgi:hypothetical protein